MNDKQQKPSNSYAGMQREQQEQFNGPSQPKSKFPGDGNSRSIAPELKFKKQPSGRYKPQLRNIESSYNFKNDSEDEFLSPKSGSPKIGM